MGESSAGVAEHDANTHTSSDEAGDQPNQEKAFAVHACITTVEATSPTAWFSSESHVCVTVWEWNQQASENLCVIMCKLCTDVYISSLLYIGVWVPATLDGVYVLPGYTQHN